jgi:hypothetical protein
MAQGPSDDASLILHELIDALTAAGNYLMAANRVLASNAQPARATLRATIENGLGQFRRADKSARRLREALRHETATDGAGGEDHVRRTEP